MRLLQIEIMKFIHDKWKKIIAYTILVGTILLAVNIFGNLMSDPEGEELVNIEGISEEINFAESIAYFQYYVERPDGVSFTNTPLINFYFTHEDVLIEMSQTTGVPLDGVVYTENYESVDITETDIFNTVEEPIINIDIIKGDHSHVYTFIAKTDDSENNLKIAQYYYNMINNDEVPFYQDKYVYTFSEPEVRNNFNGDLDILVGSQQNSVTQVIIQGIAWYALSIIIITGILVLKTLFTEKLTYSFSYMWDEKDLFTIKDSKLDNEEELLQFIAYPENEEKIILNQQTEIPFNENLFNFKTISSIADLPLDRHIDEIILIVNEGITTRKWYRKQKSLLSIHKDTIVKIVQINS